MNRARTAVVAAVLIGLVLVLPGQAAPGPGQTDRPDEGTLARLATAGSTPSAGGTSSPVALRLLATSAAAADRTGYAGTQILSAWHDGGSTSQLVEVAQAAGGPRIVNVADTVAGTAPGAGQVAGVPGGAGLSVLGDHALTERTLAALTSCYAVSLGGRGRVAGRPATVVEASRDGRTAARMWLDDETGLLLRQDVLAADGERLRRTAAFVDVEVGEAAGRGPSAAGGSPSGAKPVDVHAGWSEVPLSGLATWRAAGWPAPVAVADGFQLLDARRGTVPGGADALHLTYGDGLSAISVFLQRGSLDTSGLTGQESGWTEHEWDGADVVVRAGWPEMIAWQGGDTVITALGDLETGELESALATLPREPASSTTDTLARFARNAFGWLPG